MLESVWCPILSHVADRQIICLAVNGYECIWIRILLAYPNVAAKQGVDFQRAGDDTDATVDNTLRDLRRLLPISLE